MVIKKFILSSLALTGALYAKPEPLFLFSLIQHRSVSFTTVTHSINTTVSIQFKETHTPHVNQHGLHNSCNSTQTTQLNNTCQKIPITYVPKRPPGSWGRGEGWMPRASGVHSASKVFASSSSLSSYSSLFSSLYVYLHNFRIYMYRVFKCNCYF